MKKNRCFLILFMGLFVSTLCVNASGVDSTSKVNDDFDDSWLKTDEEEYQIVVDDTDEDSGYSSDDDEKTLAVAQTKTPSSDSDSFVFIDKAGKEIEPSPVYAPLHPDTIRLMSIEPELLQALEKKDARIQQNSVVAKMPRNPKQMLDTLFQQLSEFDAAQRAFAPEIPVMNIDKKSFNELIASNHVRKVQVVNQGGTATCAVHAVKNAMLGLHYFDDQNAAQQDMLSSNFYTNSFARDHSRVNLREDYVEELVNRSFPEIQKQNVYVLQHLERYVNLFEISNLGGVLTEQSATMAYRLSLPSYTVSFVINIVSVTDNPDAVAHWIAFTVKKEQGVVTDIIFMDSINSSLDKVRSQYLYDLCSKNERQFLDELKIYNDAIVVRKFTEKIDHYRLNGAITDKNLDNLAETFFHSFQKMELDGKKIVQKEFMLDAAEQAFILDELFNYLTEDQRYYLTQKANKLVQELNNWTDQVKEYLEGKVLDQGKISGLVDYLTSATFQVFFPDELLAVPLSWEQIEFLVAEMKHQGILDESDINALIRELTQAKRKNK